MGKIQTSTKHAAQEIVELCYLNKIKHVVISPGSRNSPLTIAFTQREEFDCLSMVDERAAAFFALGIAQQTHEPVVLVCTSGSAALNYYPAIAEAFYQKIPLIVITADRPLEWIDQSDGQTIRQSNVFQNHILKSVNLKEENQYSWYNQRLINEVINTASSPDYGPVHINVPFSEPLYDQIKLDQVPVKKIDVIKTHTLINKEVIDKAFTYLKTTKKVLVISGTNHPNDALDKALEKLLVNNNVTLLTETTSNIYSKGRIPCIDKVINTVERDTLKQLSPDLIISFGGNIVSKKVKAWLRSCQSEHWLITPTPDYQDTFQHLTKIVVSKPLDFFKQLMDLKFNVESDFQALWKRIYEERVNKHNLFFEKAPFSDLKVFYHAFNCLPEKEMVQLSNSSVVRYAQLFENSRNTPHFANRGTSGIDGSTGTAVGACYASKTNTTLFTGDLSFLYDVNSLWNKEIPNNFKIILINNRGGGIFKIIPGPSTFEKVNEFIETEHNLNAKDISKTYGFNYLSANNETELKKCLEYFFQLNKKTILEVFTPRELNESELKSYFKFLAS